MRAGAAAGFLAPAPWVKKFLARVSDTPLHLKREKKTTMKARTQCRYSPPVAHGEGVEGLQLGGGVRAHTEKFLQAGKCRHAHNACGRTRAGRGRESRAEYAHRGKYPRQEMTRRGKSLIRLGVGQKRELCVRAATHARRTRHSERGTGRRVNCRLCVYALLRAHRGRRTDTARRQPPPPRKRKSGRVFHPYFHPLRKFDRVQNNQQNATKSA